MRIKTDKQDFFLTKHEIISTLRTLREAFEKSKVLFYF